MLYALLTYEDQRPWEGSDDEAARRLREHHDALRTLEDDGTLRGSARLRPFTIATSVRIRDRAAQLTDGPFAETGEQLTGFVLIEAENLDQAIAAAAQVPEARAGTVEIRPVMAP